METKHFDIQDFTKIKVSGAFRVEITRADAFSVTVASDDLDHAKVEKEGDTLVIGHQGFEWFAPFHKRPKATITLPELAALKVSGASNGTFRDFRTEDDLILDISGASHIEGLNITAGKLKVKVDGASGLTGHFDAAAESTFHVTGASTLELSGTGQTVIMKVNGASKVEMTEFAAGDTAVSISGASKAYINLNGRLDTSASGASTLVWSGNAEMGDINISGASNVRSRQKVSAVSAM